MKNSLFKNLHQELARRKVLETDFRRSCGRNCHAGGSERQLFAEIAAGIVMQCGLRYSCSKKLWQELSRGEF